MCMPLNGGIQSLFEMSVDASVLCSLHGRCVLLEPSGSERSVTTIDAFSGRGATLGRIPLTYAVDILPDGDSLAFVFLKGADPPIASASCPLPASPLRTSLLREPFGSKR